jgi:GNAT superfamily N-acetyltransferase
MARLRAVVRDAVPDDLPDLVALWTELVRTAGRFQLVVPQVSEAWVLTRLRQAQEDPNLRVLVGSVDGTVAGMAIVHAGPLSPVDDNVVVSVDYLHVLSQLRGRGVGSSLLAAVAEWADTLGAEQVVTAISPGEREASRFYARLGFGPTVVRRSASTPVLRRALAPDPRLASLGTAGRRRLGRGRPGMPRAARPGQATTH